MPHLRAGDPAHTFLQDALAAAVASGGSATEIRVARGTYKPDQGASQAPRDRGATFQLVDGVTLEGGYAGCGAPDPDARDVDLNESVLSGDLNGDDATGGSNSENCRHVVTASGVDASAVLDGVTITAGIRRVVTVLVRHSLLVVILSMFFIALAALVVGWLASGEPAS